MGTNFYWKIDRALLPNGDPIPVDRSDPGIHIGKRSAAGLYCWDCGMTLCAQGESRVHSGAMWLDACPKCGKTKDDYDHLSTGPVAVELGFGAPETTKPTGVRGAASFSWAQSPEAIGAICVSRRDEEIIEDEYGRPYTGEEFRVMLENNCPLRRTDSIGNWFS